MTTIPCEVVVKKSVTLRVENLLVTLFSGRKNAIKPKLVWRIKHVKVSPIVGLGDYFYTLTFWICFEQT